MSTPLSEQYERQAQAEEDSAVPLILRVTRLVTWVVYAVILAKVALLVTAFLFELAGANPDASFASWVYRSADRSMDPFRGIFPTRELSDTSVLDLSLLVAAAVYLIVALLVDAVLRWLGRQLTDRDRRIADLRAAARDAAAREHATAQQLAAQQTAAQQAAAAAVAATTPRPAPESSSPAEGEAERRRP